MNKLRKGYCLLQIRKEKRYFSSLPDLRASLRSPSRPLRGRFQHCRPGRRPLDALRPRWSSSLGQIRGFYLQKDALPLQSVLLTVSTTVIALLAKETGLVLPLLVFSFDLLVRRQVTVGAIKERPRRAPLTRANDVFPYARKDLGSRGASPISGQNISACGGGEIVLVSKKRGISASLDNNCLYSYVQKIRLDLL